MNNTFPTDDRYELFYRLAGEGARRVLFVHGFPFDHTQWDPQMDALGDVATMAVPDLRGMGRSPGPDAAQAYSMARYAEDIRQLAAHLDWDRFVLAGLSMGGYIAFEFVRQWPDLVEALVLLDTRPQPDEEEGRANRRFQQEGVRRHGTLPLVEQLIGKVLGSTTLRSRPQVTGAVRAMMERASPAGVIGALEAMAGRPDSTETLADIGRPTLVIVGEEDTLTPPAVAEAMASSIAGARLVCIPRAGHLTTLETPSEVSDAIRTFLQESEPLG